MKNIVLIALTLFLLIGAVGIVAADESNSSSLSCDNAKQITVDYLNKNTGGGVSPIDCSNLGPLFQINVMYKSQNIPVYLSNDGKYYMSSAILIGDVNSPTIEGQTAGNQAINYLNNKVLGGATSKASYDSFKDLGSLYEIIVNYNGQKIPVYTTKEGAYLVQGAVDVNSNITTNPTNDSQPPKDVPKTDKPVVQVFIFSYCPYALQFEKALIPAYNLLNTKADIDIVAIGAMHGDYEMTETLRQLSIEKLYGTDKLFAYLKLFDTNKDIGACNGDSTCLNKYLPNIYNKLDIDQVEVEKYMANDAPALYDSQVKQAKDLGMNGSPTLLINGVVVPVDRSPEAIKQAVCNAFTNAPSECSTKLSSKTTTPGFGVAVETNHCGKLIYFCSDNSPYCNRTAPVIDEYATDSGCVDVIKHVIPDFMDLNKDALAIKYNVQGVPTFIFIDYNTRCFSDIGGGGNTKVEDIKNKIANFKCNDQQYPINTTNTTEDNETQPVIDPIQVCNGCSLDNKCYTFGFRKDKTYCDDKSTNFINQKTPDSVCNNNFECDSNLCVNNQCVSGNTWAKMMKWFSHLFGNK